MSDWVDLTLMGVGPTAVTVKVIRNRPHVGGLGMKIVDGVKMAQQVVSATLSILTQDPFYDTLEDEDWKRFQWAAWRSLKCRAVNPPQGNQRVSPFTADQLTKVQSKLTRISAGLNGSHGSLVIKLGFPGLGGKFCHTVMKVCGLKMTGLVQPHVLQYLTRSQSDTTGTYGGLPVVTGDIHLSQSWFENGGSTVNDAAQMIIHEAGHKFANLPDVWYLDEEDLGTEHHAATDCLKNSDSYSMFCMVATREWETKLQNGHRPRGYQSWGSQGNP